MELAENGDLSVKFTSYSVSHQIKV